MRAFILALAAMLLPAPLAAQSFADRVVDTNNPPPVIDEFGPGTYVDDGLNVSSLLESRGGHTDMEEINAGDDVGAFRFICMPGWNAAIDPVVYPGKVGASHAHTGFGNTLGLYAPDNGSTLIGASQATYQTERTSGDTTCGNPLNRSAYWHTTMIDRLGNAVRPEYYAIYYKRSPQSHPNCTAGSARYQGRCVGIPTGIRMIFGYDFITGTVSSGNLNIKCAVYASAQDAIAGTPTGETAKFDNLVDTLNACKALSSDPSRLRLLATLVSPQCWNGKDLDSPNHRSHTSDMIYDTGGTGYGKCPKTHPYVMPFFQQSAVFKLTADDLNFTYVDNGQCAPMLHFSSDCMPGMTPHKPGTTFHADYSEGWNKPTKVTWTHKCIDRGLSCSGNDLGDGTGLKQDTRYPITYVASPRLMKRPKMAMEATTVTIKAPQ